ncbi:hypothetical protein L3i23_04190 [Herbiconiux sp. L3-i23]|nr:hypothetical protein L3i23_04190 [Herbiconiux sp. L3-i23]
MRFVRSFSILSFAYPLLWLVGLGGFYWVLVGVLAFLYLIRRGPVAAALPAIGVLGALVFSLPIGVLAFGLDFGRVASLGGNLLVWLSIAALITVSQEIDLDVLLRRIVLVIGTAQGAVVTAAIVAYPSSLPIPLLQGIAGRLPSGLGAFAQNRLYSIDWLGEATFRSAGMMAQPTWAGVFGAVTCIVAVSLLTERGWWRVLAVAGVAAGTLSVVLSLSRSTQLALGAAVLIGILVMVGARNRMAFYTLAIVAAIGAVIVVLLFNEQILEMVKEINGQREGSLETRSDIYARTWELVRQLPVPILGYGIKPQEEGLVASVATHSAYLGILFRAGILGAIALFWLLINALVRSLRSWDGYAVAIAVLVLIWCTLEDFDPGHLLPLAVVLVYARTWGSRPRPVGGSR